MREIHPEGPGPDAFCWLAAAGILFRQAPDEEPDDDEEDEDEGDDNEADRDDRDGYSE